MRCCENGDFGNFDLPNPLGLGELAGRTFQPVPKKALAYQVRRSAACLDLR
jgi:hypothetical protein